MEKYLDLKEYLGVIVKYRLFIIGVLIVVSFVAGVASFLQRPVYETSSLVAITKPTFQLNFDPRFSTAPPEVQSIMSVSGLETLLKSPDVVKGVLQDLEITPSGDESDIFDWLGGMLKVSAVGGGNTLYAIRIRTDDPKAAANIANSWGRQFVKEMNDLFAPSAGPLDLIEKQLKDADGQLGRAEAAYVAFQETSQVVLLSKTLESKTSSLAAYVNAHETGRSTVLGQEMAAKSSLLSTYLGAKNSIRLVAQDAQNLKERLTSNGQASTGSASLIAPLLLEINSLNSSSKLPVQLQIPADQKVIDAANPAQQAAALDGLISTLRTNEKTASDEIDRLSSELIKLDTVGLSSASPSNNDSVAKDISATASEILALRGELARQQVEEDRLNLARSTAKSTYQTLSTKRDESKIAAGATGPVRVVSEAVEPKWPISPKRRTDIMVGALVGLLFGVVGSFLWEYVLKPGSVSVVPAVKGETVREL